MGVATPECPGGLQVLKGFQPHFVLRGTVLPRDLGRVSFLADLGRFTKAELGFGARDPNVKTTMRNGVVRAGLEFLLIEGLTLFRRSNTVNGSSACVVTRHRAQNTPS